MGRPQYAHYTDGPIQLKSDSLQIGPTCFGVIDGVDWQSPGKSEICGLDAAGNICLLGDVPTSWLLEQLTALQKRFPNALSVSKCLGLAYLSLAESLVSEDRPEALTVFDQAIDALERVMTQQAEDQEANMGLILAYCYAEDLENEEDGADYPELLNDLLFNTPEDLLPWVATACELRGRDFFQKQQNTLGFTFLKQALFIQRQRNLLAPENIKVWRRLLATGIALTSHCSAAGWESIAMQIYEQIQSWKEEAEAS